ncbi:50S ribosomal protein L19 [Candidatus Roizmanbacteria bacterium RIFOXYB2_FULL_41_10]|uniref:50S ribosomal protein L19 n=1 Tax=Candidatus Roizmanbacteria bacterium RIFOXYA1_FULL_41_12 TaxID=1802082 RepID=A0A1F7K9Z3_9BACT|nr:MAG: 50S ribosomal protein L19 [Candidatus Roizmanbacteria bacterium RIFOXYA2_FULL_41_8]OGK64640.1 MAG: 50S ribosomal protein L19 [Candidatus Roizmanbacteria bacterium RIFOXYA1_FULL_41_12]OGK67186.1 MAG: 50S ribosomal protein L19 [Candidatus Roizmanbacteria bacterium RIFOXYB1_FULL_41_27]OGK71119.1 MAG: 50S ribosomal protein L19 [Candidatus Roizmanbacteria bacterium RIFOXYC1_FULL_41_16]OGK72249.1 MAG: 50S ribosomal protein L19 [Candidatus Roizmanbacteria bacterium RIFOXYB2_FULL_41_10]OGK7525
MALFAKIKDQAVQIGDEVDLTTLYVDAGKEKKQKFSGIVIAIKNRGENKTFTVRKISNEGIGIERIFPINWPYLEEVKVKKHNKVRRAKLYYMREKIGKKALET